MTFEEWAEGSPVGPKDTTGYLMAKAAWEAAYELRGDELAANLFERGGYGVLQLNPNPHAVPRIKYVDFDAVQPVSAVKIGGVLIVRNT